MDEITQRPLITLDTPVADLRHNIPRAAELVAAGHDVFNHGGTAVIRRQGKLTVLNRAELVALIADVADIEKINAKGHAIATLPNQVFLGALFERLPQYLKEITSFAPHPVWRDGKILQSGWYDGLLVASDDAEEEQWADPAAAYQWLTDEWLCDFPFKDAISKANAIALACTLPAWLTVVGDDNAVYPLGGFGDPARVIGSHEPRMLRGLDGAGDARDAVASPCVVGHLHARRHRTFERGRERGHVLQLTQPPEVAHRPLSPMAAGGANPVVDWISRAQGRPGRERLHVSRRRERAARGCRKSLETTPRTDNRSTCAARSDAPRPQPGRRSSTA